MMRRYPVRSVLSERKMFSNGGMLPTSKPIESSMDRASGIMASSSPLIDAVSQEILAPFTGSAAAGAPSMTGAMPMAQGGIARFKNGGTARKSFNFNPSTFEITPIEEFAPRAGERTIIGQDASTEDLIRRAMFRKPDYGDLTEGLNLGLGGDSRNKAMADSTRFTPDGSIAASESFKEGFDLMTKGRGTGELVNEMFPYEASLEGGFSGGQQLRPGFLGVEQEKGPSRPIVDALRVPLQILDQAARGLSQVNKGLANYLFNFGEYVLSVKPQGTGHINFLGQIAAVNDALRRAPQIRGVSTEELGKEINQFAKIAIAEAPDMSGNELSKAIAEDIYDKYEAGLGMAASDTLQDPSGDREPTPYLGEEPIGQDIGVGNKFTIEGLSTDEDMADQEPIGQDIGVGNKFTIEGLSTDEDDAAAAAAAAAAPDPAAASAAAADPDTVVSGGDVYNKLMMESDADGGDVLRKRQTAADDANKKLLESIIKPDMSEKEATKTLADYKQKFMDEMPEYEGMSEAEKGFALMEAGLRVAAGESPNAITNVAKGLKGLGATFAKDDKEKRAWKRQVDLSAAKYALQKSSTDDANALALAKENRVFKTFIVKTPFTEGGVKYEEGSMYQPTVGAMREDNFRSILPNLTTEGIYKKLIEDKVVTAALIRKTYGPTMLGSGKGTEKGSDWEKSFAAYNDTLKDLKTSSTMVTMIDSSIEINAQGKVTGLTNLGKRAIAKLASSAGMSQQLSILNKFGEKDGIDSLKFRDQQQVIANMMLREILGEGSKNVSNIDRQLAGEIVGLMTEYGSIAAVPELLNDRLQRIRAQVTNGITTNINKLRGTEVRWENYVNRSQRSLPGELSRAKSEAVPDILMPQPKASNRRSKEVSVSERAPLLFKDFYDMKTMKQIKKIPRQ